MIKQPEYLYDVFISCSQAEREWVDEWLLPRLEQAGLRVAVDYRDFIVGMPRIDNIERAVNHSRHTIVVLTTNWLDSEWNAFEALLLRTMDPAARQRKLLPVLLGPCEPPDMIAALEKVDLIVERHWDRQLKRLIRDLVDAKPVPPPWREGGVRDYVRWRRWLRRYRRELRRGTAALCATWMAVSLALQAPPFRPRQVWMSLGLRAPHATQLVRTGDVLVAGGANVELGCDFLEMGLWRSADNGVTWQAVHAPLCFERPGQGEVLADIVGLAPADTQPARIYAATSDVGLLRSDDAGQTWRRTGDTGLGSVQLAHVAVAPDDADRVFVGAQAGGLYRSSDGGQRWERLDRRGPPARACERGSVLTGTMSVGALLATSTGVLVGTGDPIDLTDAHVPSGLYTSVDGGECWEPMDDGEGHYQYVALAHLDAASGQPVLALIRDWWKGPGTGTWGLWRLDAASSPAGRELLWTHDHTVGALLAQDGASPHWYAVTDLGEAVRGSLDVPAQVEKLPRLPRCLLPPACDVALVPDAGGGSPTLLAGGRVFELARGSWWRRVWP